MTGEIGARNIQGRAIFLSYRRDDSEGEAGRLFDDLTRVYGPENVFMDVAGIQPGLDFRKAIDANVAGCGVLLAVIGPKWASLAGSDGARCLDSPDDYVRLEIASALKRNIPVVPVLVHGASMPPAEELPDSLRDLRYRNSVELTHARWNSDVILLIRALKSYVRINETQQSEPVQAAEPAQRPVARPVQTQPSEQAHRSKLMLPLAIGAAAVIILAITVYVAIHQNPSPQPQPAPADPVAAFLGQWQDVATPQPDRKTGDELVRVQVTQEGPPTGERILVHAWGRCQPEFCDWGEHHAKLNGDELVTESWELRNTPEETNQERSAVIRMRPSGNGLTATVRNVWHPRGQTQPRQVENRLELSKGFH
jgi:hypothetical protein